MLQGNSPESYCSKSAIFAFCRDVSQAGVHTASLTNSSVFVHICQSFALLRVCTKVQVKSIRFCAFTLLTATEEKISVSVFFILSQCCGQDKHPFLCALINLLRSKKASFF